ncbi:MAG: hypothetical protein ABIC82_03905 [bacterium]
MRDLNKEKYGHVILQAKNNFAYDLAETKREKEKAMMLKDELLIKFRFRMGILFFRILLYNSFTNFYEFNA